MNFQNRSRKFQKNLLALAVCDPVSNLLYSCQQYSWGMRKNGALPLSCDITTITTCDIVQMCVIYTRISITLVRTAIYSSAIYLSLWSPVIPLEVYGIFIRWSNICASSIRKVTCLAQAALLWTKSLEVYYNFHKITGFCFSETKPTKPSRCVTMMLLPS